jgi:hypothetical protein
MNKRFSVTFVLEVDEDNNILSSVEEAHVDDVFDLVKDLFYDVDDVEVENIIVKERQ